MNTTTVTGTPTNVLLQRTSLNSILLISFSVSANSPTVSGHYAYVTELGSNDTYMYGLTTGKSQAFIMNDQSLGTLYNLHLVAVSDATNSLPSAASEPFILDFCKGLRIRLIYCIKSHAGMKSIIALHVIDS